MPLGFSRGGVIADSVYRATSLENVNVHTKEGARSYSQQGPFTSAVRVDDTVITTDGPRGAGQLVKRTWDVHNKLLICVSVGQSKGSGFTESIGGVPDPTPVYTRLNPLPRVQCFVGGVSTLQTGITISSVNDLVDAVQYTSLVPMMSNINTGRDPGEEFDHEQPIQSYGEVIAAAVPADNVVVTVDSSIGGAVFNLEMINTATLTSLTRSGTTATLVFASAQNVAAGDQFMIAAASDTNWNTAWVANTSDGTTVTFTVPNTLGSTAGAVGVVWAAQMMNVLAQVRYLVGTVAPALGLTPYLVSMNVYGFEGDTNVTTSAAFQSNQWAYARPMATFLGTEVGNDDGIAWIVWPQPDYTMFEWPVARGVQGTANPIAYGLCDVSATEANRLITYAQYACRAGGLGNATTTASHCGVEGYSDLGEMGANFRLDVANGDTSTRTPPMIDTSYGMLMTANAKTISGRFTEAVAFDTTGTITDPGLYGVKVYAGAYAGGQGYAIPASAFTVAANGIDFTATVTDFPSDFGGMYVGIAYSGAYAAPPANSLAVMPTWSANVATYTTYDANGNAANHGLVPGDEVKIVLTYPVAYGGTGTALAGTTGSTIKLTKVGNPGTLALSQATWANGIATYTISSGTHLMSPGNFITVTGFATYTGYNVTNTRIRSVTTTTFSVILYTNPGGTDAGGGACVGGGSLGITGAYGSGPVNGLRSQLCSPAITHYSHRSGVSFPRYAAHQYAPVTVQPSSKSIATMLTELNMASTFPLVHDYANASCYSGTGTAIVNLGSGGAADNFTLQSGVSFVGSAGSLDRSSYLITSGASNRYIAPAGTPDVLASLHKINGSGTVLLGGRLPASLAAINYLLATTDSTGAGFRFQISTTGALNLNAYNSSASQILTRSNGFLSFGNYFIVGFGIQNLSNQSWVLNSTPTTDTFLNFNLVYSGANTAAAQSRLYIGRNGSVGSVNLSLNVQLSFLLATDQFLTVQQIAPLFLGLKRRQMLNLP